MTTDATRGERTPLLLVSSSSSPAAAAPASTSTSTTNRQLKPFREQLYDFLNVQTVAGVWYERFMIALILLNVLAFVLATCFVEQYVGRKAAQQCGPLCDALWFGNHSSTSVLEALTVFIFTLDYFGNVYTADLMDPIHYSQGVTGRLKYMTSFFSLVDLASIVPFYIDLFTPNRDLVSSSWVRMLRLLRMMSVEGRYDTALTLVDDVYRRQRGILGTALFVGVTTWATVASLYYLVERRNPNMIYCPTCAGNDAADDGEVDTSLCITDEWGRVNCTLAGCLPTDVTTNPYPCYNLYESIPMASYYALLNLFGEFPLVTQHSIGGQIVGTLTAVVAVAVFALPAGIIGNGFESVIAEKKKQKELAVPTATPATTTSIVTVASSTTTSSSSSTAIPLTTNIPPRTMATSQHAQRMYQFWHLQRTPLAQFVDHTVHLATLVVLLTFVGQTTTTIAKGWAAVFDGVNFVATLLFAVDYTLKLYSCTAAPNNLYPSRWYYATRFMPMLDFLTFAPYFATALKLGNPALAPLSWLANPHHFATKHAMKSFQVWVNWVAALRLFRVLRWEKYTHAFGTFDAVLQSHLDVLTITAATAALLWVLFASLLYYTERNNPDPEMASNYNTIPNAMWMTLLNLSGESPLCQYSALGKIATGILGLFATAVFGIPIGVLGASFEDLVGDLQDNTAELEHAAREALAAAAVPPAQLGSWLERQAYEFVNGLAGLASKCFEAVIYVLIFLVVGVGIWQTVDGHDKDWHRIEGVAVVIFTAEYLIRFVGAGADPEFAGKARGNPILSRVLYVFSFYSIIDLLAIVPFYLALALPNSIVDQYDEYLRMFRILRLVKLDKYIPSITLLDDVIRLKFNSLRVGFFAATTLWVLFASFLFLCEYRDKSNEIDPVPIYGCDDDCSMRDRFQNYFDSLYYTGIHLTGDYPITTYTWPARFVCLFMVLAAVGVVSIPSGLIASGFVEIVQSRNRALRGEIPKGHAGDDWYEHSYRQLQGTVAPPSRFGPRVDSWQIAVNEFLNGKPGAGGHTKWTRWSYASRVFVFTVIISNILAVVLESVPSIDFAVGNEKGNFFDVFEACSVMVFAVEYMLRLFCAPKNREALYSTWVYATTFFGIVDFLSTAPWFVQQALIATGYLDQDGDNAKIFRIFRMFRILQLEDFVIAFSKLDNVFRASKDVLKATGLMAIIIWVGCGALFFIFEENNPNWRSCDSSIPVRGTADVPGCFDFKSTAACNEYYPGLCHQGSFTNMPNALFYTAVFLGGEWGVVDFTWPGRCVCLFLCVVGIALYAIPIGTLFDSFGAVLGLVEDDDEEEEDDDEGDDEGEQPVETEMGEKEPLLKK